MEELLDFLLLRDANARWVVLGVMLLNASSAVVGCFTFLRKRALVGDAVAHSILPGVALAFLLFETKNILVLLVGAFITGWLSLWAIDFITRNSKIKADSAIGLVLSVFFGIGIMLLTVIQQSGSGAQAGLDKFLFGQAASLLPSDLIAFGSVAIVLLGAVLLFYKEFTLLSFDPAHAKTIGLPVRMLEMLLSTLTVLAIAVGIQAVGVVLMAALLLTPAAAARYWTDSLKVMILLAAIFGAVAGYFGSFISYFSFFSGGGVSMPTGPWVVMVVSLIAVFSIMLAPNRGLLSRQVSKWRMRQKMREENILKTFFHLGERDGRFQHPRSVDQLEEVRSFNTDRLQRGIARLQRKGYLHQEESRYRLTNLGLLIGQRVTKLHRLWELYLTQYLRIAPDHVHEDAEAIEHIITPEIETRLEELLDYPEHDPHQSVIPYTKPDDAGAAVNPSKT